MTEKRRGGIEDIGKVLNYERDSKFFAKRGDKKRSQNDPVNALAMYMEALERDPHDHDTRLSAAEVLTDMARFNDSNKLLIPFMHEDGEFCKEAYCIVGFNLLGLGENEGAKLCFDRFFELTDEVSDRTDAMLDAIDYINSFEEDYSSLTDLKYADYIDSTREAYSSFDSGDFERAEKELKKLLPKYPEDTGILYRLALSCLCAYKYRETNEIIDKLLVLQPDNWGALSIKLMCARSLGNEIEASMLIKRLEKCDSDDPEELLRVNGALLEAGAYEAANKVASRLIKLLPYDTLSNHRLAVGLYKLGQFNRAADIYDKLVRIDRSDRIARYYRAGCIEASQSRRSEFLKQPIMIQYQMPFTVMMESVKALLSSNESVGIEDIRRRWESEPDFADMVRWSFTLGEFNIIHAMLTILGLMRDERAELMLREVIADIDARDSVINEALGILKRIDAKEPFFAISNGRLLEGRVNIIDMSRTRIPKAYRDIFKRIHDNSREILDSEVLSVASGVAERFIMCSAPDFAPLTQKQSEALSAAVEFLACERCGAISRDDLLERYGVSEKRLKNAIDKLMSVFMQMPGVEPEDSGGERE